MSDLFYRAFQEKYRGSRELINSRLQVYLPFVLPLLKAYPAGKALDVGCGRGEWLELLDEQGFDALGVDLDDGMLQACREKNLNVETADAVTYMKGLTASSLCIVSAFHVAEHLPFEVLQQLVQQALRVLVPGGLLILESPNPENITVGTNSFYLDPTHQRPIPPELLSFLPEHYGFARCKVLRLQESAHLHDASHIGLMDVLGGVSPDYAVVAQKQGVPLLMEALTPAFDTHYGLTLNHLAKRHEQAVDKRLMAIEAKAEQAQEQAMQAEVKAQQAREQAMQAEVKAQQAQEQAMHAEAKAHKAEAASTQHMAELQAVYASRSWQLTAPLRWAFKQTRSLRKDGLKSRIGAFSNKALRRLNHELLIRPALRQRMLNWSRKVGVHGRLKTIITKAQGYPQSFSASFQESINHSPYPEILPPRAKRIYTDLTQAIEHHQKENN